MKGWMVVLDIAAPISLMYGLSHTNSANVSLLNNFETVATSIIALIIFKKAISKRLWMAIFFVSLSSVVLTCNDLSGLEFSWGSLLFFWLLSFGDVRITVQEKSQRKMFITKRKKLLTNA